MRETKKYNLKKLLKEVVRIQPGIEEIHLFGSRAYKTGSLRSDCDLLLRVSDKGHVKRYVLTDFAVKHCPPLDFFLAEGGKATSCANDSFVQAASFTDLVKKLDAILLWSNKNGFAQFEFDFESRWVFETAMAASFPPTILPNDYLLADTWQATLARAETAGLPVHPYIGDTIEKATAQITDVARKMVISPNSLGQRGAAKSGWTVDLQSEYDCQNLFWTVVKPWLPSLGREETTIRYEKQDKISDFTLFEGRLVIELKYIDSGAKKREVLKDLDGLSRFYSRNSNIRCLLLLIYYKDAANIDEMKLQADFTFVHNTPIVVAHFIKLP
jgi:hypothetical protein